MKQLRYKKQINLGRLVCNTWTLRSFHSNNDCSVMWNMIEALPLGSTWKPRSMIPHMLIVMKHGKSPIFFYTPCTFIRGYVSWRMIYVLYHRTNVRPSCNQLRKTYFPVFLFRQLMWSIPKFPRNIKRDDLLAKFVSIRTKLRHVIGQTAVPWPLHAGSLITLIYKDNLTSNKSKLNTLQYICKTCVPKPTS
jgi:hypothetical protein